MAILESLGFHGGPDVDYWRKKVEAKRMFANSRMVWKVRELCEHTGYELAGMVHRATLHRTDEAEKLYPREAWNLIEGLKKIIAREADEAAIEAAIGQQKEEAGNHG